MGTKENRENRGGNNLPELIKALREEIGLINRKDPHAARSLMLMEQILDAFIAKEKQGTPAEKPADAPIDASVGQQQIAIRTSVSAVAPTKEEAETAKESAVERESDKVLRMWNLANLLYIAARNVGKDMDAASKIFKDSIMKASDNVKNLWDKYFIFGPTEGFYFIVPLPREAMQETFDDAYPVTGKIFEYDQATGRCDGIGTQLARPGRVSAEAMEEAKFNMGRIDLIEFTDCTGSLFLYRGRQMSFVEAPAGQQQAAAQEQERPAAPAPSPPAWKDIYADPDAPVATREHPANKAVVGAWHEFFTEGGGKYKGDLAAAQRHFSKLHGAEVSVHPDPAYFDILVIKYQGSVLAVPFRHNFQNVADFFTSQDGDDGAVGRLSDVISCAELDESGKVKKRGVVEVKS